MVKVSQEERQRRRSRLTEEDFQNAEKHARKTWELGKKVDNKKKSIEDQIINGVRNERKMFSKRIMNLQEHID